MRTRRPRPLTLVWRSLVDETRRRETASFVVVEAVVVVDLAAEEVIDMGGKGREKDKGRDGCDSGDSN